VLVTEPTVQSPPVAVIVGVAELLPVSFDDAVTVNCDPFGELDGAPVKLTVGVVRSAVVFCAMVEAM
jgi:hypothetical protein